MKFSKKRIIEVITILLLGFIPLLWFRGKEVILGHDAGLTLYPVSHFLDRLYSWTERFAFGSDQSFALPGFFIHGLEASISHLGFGLQAMQKIVFIFWFVLPGLTMYYFVSRFGNKENGNYIALPAAIFYMFNHFLLQGWFIAERTKFSLYAALPLVIAFLFDWEEDKRSSLKTALLISITLFFLNGGGSLPLFGGILVSVLAFTIFYLIYNLSKSGILKISKLFLQVLVISSFFNAYWILPYFYFVKNFYSATVSQEGGINGILGWIDYVSSGTSLGNLLRLQGVPEWYQNPFHPYASYFLHNPLLLLIASLIPVLAFLPLYVIKNRTVRKRIIFFSFLALFSLIFIAGSQPPFGIIYILLVKFVPGFIVFRTPFYKFAPALWFSYAILIGFSFNYLSKKLEVKNKAMASVSIFIFCLIIILYNFPFLNGMFFDYIKGVRSMRVTVPSYVFDFGRWSQSSGRINRRTLALPAPAGNVDAYNWGYWSLAPLTTLLTNAPIINESGYTPIEQDELLKTLYQMMKENKKGWQNLARMLEIKSFLLRNDFDWNLKGSLTDSPDVYKKALNSSDLVLTKKFGEWDVYDFKDDYAKQEIEASKSLTYIVGNRQDLNLFVNLPIFNLNEPVYLADSLPNGDLINMADLIYIKPECEDCNLSRPFVNIDLYMPLLTRNSIFYPLTEFDYKLNERAASISLPVKLRFYLYNSLTKILSLQKVIAKEEPENIIFQSITDYYTSLNKLDFALSDYLNLGNIDNKLLMEANEVVRIERPLVIGISSKLSKEDQLDLFYKAYLFLNYIKEEINKHVWQTTDEDHKRLLINSPKDGEYNMLYGPNDPFLKIPDEITFSLDGVNYKRKPEVFDGEWWSFGKAILSYGKHYLEIEQPVTNLYSNPSLDLPIFSSKEGSCIFSNTIEGLRKDDIYRISFEHQRTSGDENFTVKIVPDKINLNPFDKSGDILRSTSYWNYYEKDYPLAEDGEKFRVAICNYPSAAENLVVSSIQLKDINIRQIAVPDVVLYSTPDYKKTAMDVVSKRKSQVQYDLMINSAIQDKFLLTLNETYHPGWKLNGLKTSGRFMSNGYGNGWIVDGANKGKTSITYIQQDLEKYGFLITVTALLAGSIVFFIKHKKDRNSL